MHANVYVDAFNLYYRTLKGTPHRWLDLRALSLRLLGSAFTLHRIRYFTALIRSGKVDPQKRLRQQIYLRALQTIPELEVHLGHYASNTVRMPLASSQPGKRSLVKVIRTEEKGSDANLAAYLTRDAAKRDGHAAFVITGDSDFAGAIQMVRRDFSFPVHIVDPKEMASRHLEDAATSYQLLDRALLPQCQFPGTLSDAQGTITRPQSWA